MKMHKINKQSVAPARVVKPSKEEIARLAYTIFEREGKPDGMHLVHWFNAEAMMESQFGAGRDHTEHDFSKSKGDE